jgi:hypothetical protein
MGTITIDELATRIHEICDGIEQNGNIWQVGDEEHHFILAPPSIARFDLIDEEYGWPSLVDLDQPITPEQLALRHRHHPLLIRRGRLVAIAISSGEYETFRELEAACASDSAI